MFSYKVVLILSIVFAIFLVSEAKVYSPCEFAQAMKNQGVNDDLGTWTCIASHESNFNTQAINYDTGDYGILQISHLYWCSDSDTPGKECGITCQSLLGDDITEDIICAKKVFSETVAISGNGFTAWTTYSSCGGDQSSWIKECNL
ncbi:hypothetical protein GWI33_020039 [Rhynchophorus ferrugineus]|uniref:lysozyme n=1 Tax=Rhynchophorus ferrugineus TaxID=354439 RepID=A0A834HV28_RHYFE|nr:hypothetical protein GWI33_020039 [Rhynchophorus ferrugineus]